MAAPAPIIATAAAAKVPTQAVQNALKRLIRAKQDKIHEVTTKGGVASTDKSLKSKSSSSSSSSSNHLVTLAQATKKITGLKALQEHNNRILSEMISFEVEKEGWQPGGANIVFFQYAGAISTIGSCLLQIESVRWETEEELNARISKAEEYGNPVDKIKQRILIKFKGIKERIHATEEQLEAIGMKTEFAAPPFWNSVLAPFAASPTAVKELNTTGYDLAIFVKDIKPTEKTVERESNGQVYTNINKFISVNGVVVKDRLRDICDKKTLQILDPLNLCAGAAAASDETSSSSTQQQAPSSRKRKASSASSVPATIAAAANSTQPPPQKQAKLSSASAHEHQQGGGEEGGEGEGEDDFIDSVMNAGSEHPPDSDEYFDSIFKS